MLSLLVSHAHTSGLTPSSLASLFGPLLFGLSLSSPYSSFAHPDQSTSTESGHANSYGEGLSPASGASFHQVHETYLGNANAFEHLLLSYIRFKEVTTPGGIPPKMANWIKGYPRSIIPSAGLGSGRGRAGREELLKPRKGAKMVRALAVRRNVRVYSSDLVRSCASWAAKGGGVNALVQSREWSRIAPYSIPVPSSPGGFGSGEGGSTSAPPKMEPRYSDVYRKRMNLPSAFYPISTPFVVSTTVAASPSRFTSPSRSHQSPHSSTLSPFGRNQTPHSRSTTSLTTNISALDENEELRFNSLVDLRWAAFESLGFENDQTRLEKALTLDLNESARKVCLPLQDLLCYLLHFSYLISSRC
jgi:hypothetical protein